MDARENFDAPSNQHRHKRSPNQYTSYMARISESVEIEPFSFKELVQKPVWIDAMVEEYESISKIVLGRLFQGWWENQL